MDMSNLVEKTGKSISEIQELMEIFQLVDTDHGGTISRSELETLMKTVGLSATNNDMQLLMSEIDPTGSGEIDFDSFAVCVTKKVQTTITLKELQYAFSVIETYDSFDCQDGTISMKALLEAFTKYSPSPMALENAMELVREVIPQGETQSFDYVQFLNLQL